MCTRTAALEVVCGLSRKEEQKMRRQIKNHRNHGDRSIAKQVSDFISVNMNLPLTMCDDVN